MRTKIYLLKIELLIKMKNANNFFMIRFCDFHTALLLKLKQKINYLKYYIF